MRVLPAHVTATDGHMTTPTSPSRFHIDLPDLVPVPALDMRSGVLGQPTESTHRDDATADTTPVPDSRLDPVGTPTRGNKSTLSATPSTSHTSDSRDMGPSDFLDEEDSPTIQFLHRQRPPSAESTSSRATPSQPGSRDELFVEGKLPGLRRVNSQTASPYGSRRVVWGDASEGRQRPLTNHMSFRRDDEAWRCNIRRSGPVLGPVTPPCMLIQQPEMLTVRYDFNGDLPESSAQLLHAVVVHGVQLESLVVLKRGMILYADVHLLMCRRSRIGRTVRVQNQAYEKTVTVRVTFDDWHIIDDIPCTYISASGDHLSDRFMASIDFPDPDRPCHVIFAIKYESAGRTSWDNNGGANYSVAVGSLGPSDDEEDAPNILFSPLMSPIKPCLRPTQTENCY